MTSALRARDRHANRISPEADVRYGVALEAGLSSEIEPGSTPPRKRQGTWRPASGGLLNNSLGFGCFCLIHHQGGPSCGACANRSRPGSGFTCARALAHFCRDHRLGDGRRGEAEPAEEPVVVAEELEGEQVGEPVGRAEAVVAAEVAPREAVVAPREAEAAAWEAVTPAEAAKGAAARVSSSRSKASAPRGWSSISEAIGMHQGIRPRLNACANSNALLLSRRPDRASSGHPGLSFTP